MKFIQIFLIITLIIMGGCEINPSKNINDNEIFLKVGESKIVVQHKNPSKIIGGYIDAFYVVDRTIADLEIKDDGIYIIGKTSGKTFGTTTNWAYLDDRLLIRDEPSHNFVEKDLEKHPIKILVTE